MVDSHQLLIDNYDGNSKSKSDSEPILTTNAIPMSEIVSQQSNELNGSSSSLDATAFQNNHEKNEEKLHEALDEQGEIMCGSSPKQELSTNEIANCTNNTQTYTQNGDASNPTPSDISEDNNFESQIVSINRNECSIVNNQQKISKSNDSSKTSNHSTDPLNAHENSVDHNNTKKMDSRKVEPIRININRDPIKTKIKLGPSSHDCQTISLKASSSSSNNDECDNANDVSHENTQNYPKITIKPIVKPSTNYHHNQNNAGLQASSSSSASHEAIPKLKIKKIDSSSSANNQTPKSTLVAALNSDEITTNYQTHLLSESSTTVPT